MTKNNETKHTLGDRLVNGLIEGIEYIKNDKGLIDWFKMIPQEHLYLNKDKTAAIEKRLGKSFSEVKVSEAIDSELVVKLSGIQWLLSVRGYEYSKILLNNSDRDFASATCEIKFIPNVEDLLGQTFSACASAHRENTRSWYQNYLSEAASNRALCRAVRFYLNIATVSSEELGGSGSDEPITNTNTGINPVEMLEKAAASKGYTFLDLKRKLTNDSQNYPGCEKYTKFSDIPKEQILKILEKFNSKKTT